MTDLSTTQIDAAHSDLSLNDSIQRHVLQLIKDDELLPDSRLPSESVLSHKFGVSRSALREALRTLEGAGYLESRTGSGWYVKQLNFDALTRAITYALPLDFNTLSELAEVRALLEVNLLEAAIPTLTPQDLDDLEDAVDEMELLATTSGHSFAGPDQYFHRKLFSRLDNQVVLNLLDIFWRLQMTCCGTVAFTGEPIEEARKHRRLLNAVRAGDVALSRRRMQESLEEKRLRFQVVGGRKGSASRTG